ncbi:4065_t:CDS:2, partial [Cetraspora pellucida]
QAKNIALKIEMYNKNIKYNVKKASKTLLHKTFYPIDKDVNITQLTEVFENLKLRHVMSNLMDELEKVKTICFVCQEIDHIVYNCLNKRYQDKGELTKEREDNQMVKRINIYFFELMDKLYQSIRSTLIKNRSDVVECLKVKIDLEVKIFNMSNTQKCHYVEPDQVPNKKEKVVNNN